MNMSTKQTKELFASTQLELSEHIKDMSYQAWILIRIFDTGLHWVSEWEKWLCQ